MIKEITLCKKEDIENRFLRDTRFKSKYVEPTEELTGIAWTYDYDNHIFKAVTDGTMTTYIVLNESKFNVGDIVKIDLELYCKNEISSFIEWAFRNPNDNTVISQDNYKIYSNDLNKWKKVSLEILVTKKSNLQISIGIPHGTTGEYMMKPPVIKYTKLEESEDNSVVIKKFALVKENGVWKINDKYSTDTGTIGSNGNALQVVMKNPFTKNTYPIVNCMMGNKGNKYLNTLWLSRLNYFAINFYELSNLTNGSIPYTDVEDGAELFVTVIQ